MSPPSDTTNSWFNAGQVETFAEKSLTEISVGKTKFAIFREGAGAVAERAVNLAGSLLKSHAPSDKTERGDRKAHRLEVEKSP